jgi:indole-3-glycerol phosphate synthase
MIPEPLSLKTLQSVPGVLGKICLERFQDYVNAARTERPFPTRPSFAEALKKQGLAIIAEVKRSSPSQGAIADLDPVKAAQDYVAGGAAAISVLTEPRHFGGEINHLQNVAQVVSIPLLRKDFTVHPMQILEAKQSGASAILLIVAATQNQTRAYLDYTHSLGLDALIEVHDEAELDTALEAGADIIGINNRDLRTLEIDLNNAPRLIQKAKDKGFKGILVAESGYSKREHLESLIGVADAILIGTSLAKSGDLQKALQTLTKTD